MRKVYIVLHTLSIGGAERHASTIANYLSRNDYNVTIILLDNNTVEFYLEKNIDVVSISHMSFPSYIANSKTSISESLLLKLSKLFSKKDFLYYDKFLYYKKKYIERLKYFFEKQNNINTSLVIAFSPTPEICTAIINTKIDYKLILGEFNSPHLDFEPSAPENRIKKKYFPNANGFVFQTEEQKSFYSYLRNVKKAVIPNPIDEIKTKPYDGIRKKVIVNFCRLTKVKNIPLLIEAFSRLSKDFPEYSLLIYGEGAEEEKLKEQISLLGLEKMITIMPFEKNILEFVRDCTMFVSSSDKEGISNSMLEAMAIGLPVICTDCPAGGARMMIKPYENGILVPVRDPEAMYQAMKYMIEHPDKAEEMGRKAVKVRQTLEKNKILQQWLSFIESI